MADSDSSSSEDYEEQPAASDDDAVEDNEVSKVLFRALGIKELTGAGRW
jgi:hypothetical protein